MATPAAQVHRRSLCRILLVDDHDDAITAMTMLLKYEGHEVAVADRGQRALELIESFRPHIALIDIGMPDMDGYTVARRIRALSCGRDVYLIAVTGWARPDDQAEALEAGFNLHIPKPIDFVKLDHVLNQFECSKASATP